MADNEPITEVEGMPSVTDKSTAEIEAIVDRRLAAQLKKLDYMTSKQATALIEAQTLAFEDTVRTMRTEIMGEVGTIKSTISEWGRTLAAQDVYVRRVEEQNQKYALLSSNIEGQNKQISDTLTRFSTRLDDIGDDIEAKVNSALTTFQAVIEQAVKSNGERIAALEKNDQRRNDIEAHLKAIPRAIINTIKHPLTQSIAVRLVGGTAIGAVIAEVLRILGGG